MTTFCRIMAYRTEVHKYFGRKLVIHVDFSGKPASFYHPFYKTRNKNRLAKVRKETNPASLCMRLSKKYVADHSIVLSLPLLKLERILEDHEKVIHFCLESRKFPEEVKLYYRVYPEKFEYFTDPEKVFNPKWSYLPEELRCPTNPKQIAMFMDLKRTIATSNEVPYVFGYMRKRREDKNLIMWDFSYFQLKERILYKSADRPKPERDYPGDVSMMQADLYIEKYELYMYVSAQDDDDQYRFCLKENDCYSDSKSDIHFKCDTEEQRTYWMTAIRHSKYTTEIQENYKDYSESKPYSLCELPDASERTLAALSFAREKQRIENMKKKGVYFPKSPMKLEKAARNPHLWSRFFERGEYTSAETAKMLKDKPGVCMIRYSKFHEAFIISYFKEDEEKQFEVRVYKVGKDKQVSQIPSENRYYCLQYPEHVFYDLLHLVDFCQLNLAGMQIYLKEVFTKTAGVTTACTEEFTELREPKTIRKAR